MPEDNNKPSGTKGLCKNLGFKNLIKKTAHSKSGLAKLTKESRQKKRQKYNTG